MDGTGEARTVCNACGIKIKTAKDVKGGEGVKEGKGEVRDMRLGEGRPEQSEEVVKGVQISVVGEGVVPGVGGMVQHGAGNVGSVKVGEGEVEDGMDVLRVEAGNQGGEEVGKVEAKGAEKVEVKDEVVVTVIGEVEAA